MTMTQIRRVLVASATLVTLSAFAPAHAYTLNFTDNNCASFSVTGTAPNFTLTCSTTPPPPPTTPPPTTPPPTTPPVSTGAGGAISCGGFKNTRVVDLDYAPGGQTKKYSSDYGAFGGGGADGDIVVARFTTPVGAGGMASVSVAEYGGAATSRTAYLSTTACSFASPYVSKTVSAKPVFFFALQQNTTYYLNIKNVSATGSSCSSNCPIVVTLTAP